MIIWLPHENFRVTSMVLDSQLLRSQVDACRWAQRSIQGVLIGWDNHPTVLLWRDHIMALMMLSDCHIRELHMRGIRTRAPIMLARDVSSPIHEPRGYETPPWVGTFEYHSSMRSVLLDRDPEWYSQWGWGEEPGTEIRWPVVQREGREQ